MMQLKRNEELIILILIFAITGTAIVFKYAVFNKSTIEVEKMDKEYETPAVEKPVELFAYITGEVKNPGVYKMKAGDRIADLVNAAGGFTENADRASVNLAEKLRDEQQVFVAPVNAEQGGETDSRSSIIGGKININSATAEEIDSFLPGIGSTLAKNIVDYRTKNGRFKSVDEITRVDGIGNGKRFEKIKDMITVN